MYSISKTKQQKHGKIRTIFSHKNVVVGEIGMQSCPFLVIEWDGTRTTTGQGPGMAEGAN